jgi:hypothetical protein
MSMAGTNNGSGLHTLQNIERKYFTNITTTYEIIITFSMGNISTIFLSHVFLQTIFHQVNKWKNFLLQISNFATKKLRTIQSGFEHVEQDKVI